MKKLLLNFPVLLLLLISSALTIFLFRRGNLMGGGEIGLQFYNLEAMWGITGWAWGNQVLGGGSSLTVAAAPFFALYGLLHSAGLSGFLSQALFFFLVFSLSLISMYLLIKELFPAKPPIVYISSALFYLVNPYALVNIWNRFLQNPMLFYAFIPLGIWLFIRGLKENNYRYTTLSMLLSAVFSLGFAGPTQTLSFWFLLGLVSLFYYVFIEKKRFVVNNLLYSVILWLLFNFFWVSQQLFYRFSASYSVVAANFFTQAGNLQTFIAQSRVLGQLSNLFLFQHGPFFNQSVDLPYKWPLFYINPLAKLLAWSVILVVLFVSIKKRKSPWVSFLLFLFFLGVFSSKGNSPPFGEIFDYLFKRFSFLEFFRNPFEKLGFLLPLSFSPLFGFSFGYLRDIFSPAKRKIVNAVVVFYLVIFLGFPFWTGLVFTSGNPPANNPSIGYDVQVPGYYEQANKYLSQEGGIFRFITFPLGGEGIFNNWPKGYAGVEQSGVLFSTPSISYITTIPFLSSVGGTLEKLFIQNVDFYKIARLFTASHIVFRPDFDLKLSGMRAPETIEKILEERVTQPASKLSFVKSFEPLKIFKYSSDIFLPKVYPAEEIIINNSSSNIEDVFFANDSKNPAVYSQTGLFPEQLTSKASTEVIHSTEYFHIPGSEFPSYSEDAYIFPYVSILPSSRLYPLVLLKEKIQALAKVRLEDKTNWKLAMLGKRLMEAKMALEKGDTLSAQKTISLYEKSLPAFLNDINTLNSFAKKPDERVWHQGELFSAFSSHMYLFNKFLDSPLNQDGSMTSMKQEVQAKLNNARIIPIFNQLSGEDFPIQRRFVYQLKIVIPGEYEILIPKNGLFPDKYSLGEEVYVQIDNEIRKLPVVVKERFVSLGGFRFGPGVHEIALNQSSHSNLAGEPKSFDFETADYTKKVSVPIEDFDPFGQYNVYFEYWTQRGDGIKFLIEQNTDPLPTLRRPDFTYYPSKTFVPDYYYDYLTYETYFKPEAYTDSALLAFSIKPWSNCRLINYKNPDKCKRYDFDFLYYRPTRVYIRNIDVRPLLPQQIELVRKDTNISLQPPESVNFRRINQTLYDVEVKGADSAFLLTFSELFDTGWKAYVTSAPGNLTQWPFAEPWRSNQVSDNNHYMVNGYANSWWIDTTGNYHVILEYLPQRLLYIGYFVSAVVAFVAILYFAFRLIKKKGSND